MGASIYFDLRKEDIGRICLIGIDSRLSPQCLFDDGFDITIHYQNMDSGRPGSVSTLAINLLQWRSKSPDLHGWDSWIESLPGRYSGGDERSKKDIESTTIVRKPGMTRPSKWFYYTFCRFKLKDNREESYLRINIVLEEKVIKSQRMFVVRYKYPSSGNAGGNASFPSGGAAVGRIRGVSDGNAGSNDENAGEDAGEDKDEDRLCICY